MFYDDALGTYGQGNDCINKNNPTVVNVRLVIDVNNLRLRAASKLWNMKAAECWLSQLS